MAIGLRFAGSANEEAFTSLVCDVHITEILCSYCYCVVTVIYYVCNSDIVCSMV